MNQTRNSIYTAALYVYGRMFLIQILNLFAISILAHKLDVKDFGLVALANVSINFLNIFISQGVNEFVIYFKSNDFEKFVNSAFWLNLLISLIIVIVGLISAPFIGEFFDNEKVPLVLSLLLLTLPLDAASKIPDSLQIKQLNFKFVELRDASIQILTSLFSILLSFYNFGVWSLILPILFMSPLRLFTAYYFVQWRPKLNLDFRLWPQIFRYSSSVIGDNFTYFILSEGDSIMIGKFLGPIQLGYYNLSWRLSNLVTKNIVNLSNKITFPLFSSISKGSPDMAIVLTKVLGVISLISFPLLMILFVFAPEFIALVYGDKWLDAIIPLRILIIYSIRFSIGSPLGAFFKSVGRPEISFKLGLITIPFYLLAVYIGKNYGIIGVSIGITIVRTLFGLYTFKIASRLLDVSLGYLFKPIWAPFSASLILSFMLFGISVQLNCFINSFHSFILCLLLSVPLYALIIKVGFNKLWIDLIELKSKFY